MEPLSKMIYKEYIVIREKSDLSHFHTNSLFIQMRYIVCADKNVGFFMVCFFFIWLNNRKMVFFDTFCIRY